jgi:hypothetical protein
VIFEKAEAELEAFLKYAKPSESKEDYAPLIKQHREAVDRARDVMFELMNMSRRSTICASPIRGRGSRQAKATDRGAGHPVRRGREVHQRTVGSDRESGQRQLALKKRQANAARRL